MPRAASMAPLSEVDDNSSGTTIDVLPDMFNASYLQSIHAHRKSHFATKSLHNLARERGRFARPGERRHRNAPSSGELACAEEGDGICKVSRLQ